MHKAKRPAIRRFWMIDKALRERTYPTSEDLARLAEVDSKTIRRDIQSMRDDQQAPVAFNPKKRGWEYTDPTYRLPAVVMTEGELVALFLASQALQSAQGTLHAEDLQRAILKLSQFLPDEVSVHWQTLEQAQSFHQTVTTVQDTDQFRQLADAALHHRQLRVRYWTASREEETDRVIDPYHLACIDGTWYLLGFCHARKSVRTFAPARIREMVATGETFTRPDEFRLGDYFEGTFKVVSESHQPLQNVRLRFVPSAGKYIREKIWHASQKLQVERDHSVVLELALRSLIEVRRWILSWGSECEVLEPAALREEIRREALAMLEKSRPALQRSSKSTLETIEAHRQRRQQRTRKKGAG